MAARCCICDEVIDEARCLALVDSSVPLDKWTCIKHGFNGEVRGYMGESGGKEGRKTGYVLTVITEYDPNFKENLRRAEMVNKRKR